jgi:hypothetical protein
VFNRVTTKFSSTPQVFHLSLSKYSLKLASSKESKCTIEIFGPQLSFCLAPWMFLMRPNIGCSASLNQNKTKTNTKQKVSIGLKQDEQLVSANQ